MDPRRKNSLTLATAAAVFAVTPITPAIAGISTALAARRRANPARTLDDATAYRAHVIVETYASGRPDELPRGGFDSDIPPWAGTVDVRILFGRHHELARVVARRYPGDAFWRVKKAYADHGWGPLAYDLAMERVTELGSSLTHDLWHSEDAKRVWAVYARRPDVLEVLPETYSKAPMLLRELRRRGAPDFVELDEMGSERA